MTMLTFMGPWPWPGSWTVPVICPKCESSRVACGRTENSGGFDRVWRAGACLRTASQENIMFF